MDFIDEVNNGSFHGASSPGEALFDDRNMVTGRGRIRRVLSGRPCDRQPMGEILFTGEFIKRSPWEDLADVAACFGCDLVTLPVDSTSCAAWAKWRSSPCFLMGSLSGPLFNLMETRGWKGAAALIVKQPKRAAGIMGAYLSRMMKRIERAVDAGCEGVLVADDIAGAKGPLFSPRFLREFYFPLFGEYLHGGRFRGIPFLFHSDGKILQLIHHVRAAGFRGVQGLQPCAGISPEDLLVPEFEDFLFWGNFEFEGEGRLKTIDEVEKEVGDLLERWKRYPRYIFGSSGGIYGGLDPRTVKAAFQRAGRGSKR